MNKKTALAAVAVLAASTFAGFAAQANPIYVGYSLDGGTTIVQVGNSGSNGSASSGGTVAIPGTGFAVQISGTGAPFLGQGSLFSNSLSISSATAGTINLYASETGNTGTIASFTTGFSNDSLSSTSVLERTYATAGTNPFATGNLLSSATVNPGAAMSTSTVAAPAGLGALFTVTDRYTVTFGAGGGSVNATLNLTANPVPEPATLALLGAGLVGVGVVRRRQKA